MRDVQIGDERAHQARLAHAGRQREAKRGEVALEIADTWIFAADSLKRGVAIGALAQRDDLGDAAQDFETVALRLAQAEASGDGIDMTLVRC
ncbi:hypothetical protein FHX08_002751 [Rhizobium sp. BK529]|nr:hypothetical protein [Rhizobium sp. BK529]